ncbi:ABC transporter ATP-binding protein [Phototrophicus methaneseepsis]|uniref:ABC transporter ATP-binding protein n=1 Tax=Phototrophicus methaneseepsis TaxID=2710758 RepID=A0A7S8EBI6_9CHLR|nr:ABC transporter ATP-binding protein [Phototrophicus methaneseepsis]QPC83928.1 ABC transporter ATP-binding protein [Phototrophicus methaneseepsis]
MRVQIDGLNHTFQQRPPLRALDDIALDVESGEFVAMIGPSGCGKSTLLRLVAGLATPTQGMISLDDQPPQQIASEKRIAWMSQQVALLPWRTVRTNIALAQQINPQPKRRSRTVDDLLDLVGLREFEDAYPFTLSGGMQQRVALARTLALGADLWLMDEPFAALDQLTRDQLVVEVLEYWRKLHPTVLWVTHQIQEAVLLANRVLVMTPRPAHIYADVPVDLPYPRDDTSRDFQALVRQLRETIAAGMQFHHDAQNHIQNDGQIR